MDNKQFWELVTISNPAFSDEQQVCDALYARLEQLSDDDLRVFEKLYTSRMKQAYTWPLWGAAHVITGGCGYDDFIDFRNWLIALGEDWFERALNSPDTLAELSELPMQEGQPMPFLAEYDLVAGQVYESRNDDELPFYAQVADEPAGREWEDKPAVLKALYPKLAEKYPLV